MTRTLLLLLLLALIVPSAACADLSGAKWIWHPANSDTVYFRKVVEVDRTIERMELLISADDAYEVWVNGRMFGAGSDWQKPQRYEIGRPVARENSVIAVKASNRENAAGLICSLAVHFRDGTRETIVSDESWVCASSLHKDWDALRFRPDDSWVNARVVGEYPCKPWGRIVKESWESLSARLEARRQRMAAVPVSTRTQYSAFKGEYLRPEHANMYRDYVKLNPKTGLLEYEGRVIRPFFTVYSQPRPDGGWILNIPDLDFDLLEHDFARMKQAGINVQPRFWSWAELLTSDGEWREVEKQPRGRGLPYFRYVYEIYNHFLNRAQAHGLYVNIEPSYYWGLHPDVVPPQYRGKILLYPELWDATNQAYAKILNYFSKRAVIIAVMVGEEDLHFDHCLDEPAMADRFRRNLRRQYGQVSNLQRTWGHGYDLSDHTQWKKRTIEGREVVWPEYPFVQGAFNSCLSFDVPLPLYDYCRSSDDPKSILADMPTHQRNLIREPSWVDFMETKEQILVSRLNDLAEAFRDAAPNHVLFYSNPHDFNPAWHMLHVFDRGKLKFDVIGVGQHDKDFDPPEVSHWARSREYIKNAASYGPYLGATGAYPKGFACGEGMGGRTREGTAAYYPWWLTDIVGSGGAFFQSYDWNHIAGRTFEKPTEYDENALTALGGFLEEIRNAAFTREANAPVLILRNKRAAYGMSAGYDFANSRYLASILCQLHIPFDILPDSDLASGDFEPGKVNLSKYSFIFIPAQNQLLSSGTWQMLEDWISDPRFAGRRGLCMGLYQHQDGYFNPVPPTLVHPAFERLTGTQGFSSRLSASGKVRLKYSRYFGTNARGNEQTIDFPANAEIGCFENLQGPAEKILEMDGGASVVIRNTVNANPVYLCGFYLGMAYDPVWGLEKEQEPYNALNPLYLAMLISAGVQPSFAASDNVGIYLADDSWMFLLKERFGKRTDVDIEFKGNRGAVFDGTTTVFELDGTVRVKDFSIEPYETKVLRKAAGLLLPEGAEILAVCKALGGGLEANLTGSGKVPITFELKPGTIYIAKANGELVKMFTAGPDGRHSIDFDLGSDDKPLLLTITPSER